MDFKIINLFQTFNFPHVILLQETCFKLNEEPYFFRKYKCIFYNKPYNTHKSGVIILIHKSQGFSKNLLNLNTLAVSVSIKTNPILNHVSLYSENSSTLSINDLNIINNNFQNQLLIDDEFNTKHLFWGEYVFNSKGLLLENCLLSSKVVVLNDGSHKYYKPLNSFFSIDLTLASPNISLFSTWKPLLSP